MRHTFGALVALAVGWGLCAPAHAQELFPLQAISGGGGGGTCAAPVGAAAADAAAAGFNTVALCNDFTTAIPNTVGTGLPSNWLNCGLHGVSGAVWNVIPGAYYSVPCPASYTQVADPTYGNLALKLNMKRSYVGDQSEDNRAQLITAPANLDNYNVNTSTFSTGYFEITYRRESDASGGACPSGSHAAFWSYGGEVNGNGGTFVEQDFFEDWGTCGGGLDTAIDWYIDWNSPGGSISYRNGPSYPSHSEGEYHTIGALVTGPIDHLANCYYFDGVATGCFSYDYNDPRQNSAQRRYLWIDNGIICNGDPWNTFPSCMSTNWNESNMYVQSVKVVTCSAETTGGSCLGSTYNGSFYTP